MDFAVATKETAPGRWLVSLEGEVDLYTAPELRKELLGIVEAGAGMIVVDLTKTTFFDSTALGVLLSAKEQLRDGSTVCVVCGDRNITKIFTITGLDRVFGVYPTLEDALSAEDPLPFDAVGPSRAPGARPIRPVAGEAGAGG